eukprot:8945083-Alexandrium_andersonii.AAC.1
MSALATTLNFTDQQQHSLQTSILALAIAMDGSDISRSSLSPALRDTTGDRLGQQWYTRDGLSLIHI